MGRRLGPTFTGTRVETIARRLSGAIVLTALSVPAGCSFSAQATGSVNSSGDAEGDASYSAKTEPPAEETTPPEPSPAAPAIQLKKGRLEYRGVINFEYDKAILREDEATKETMAEFRRFLENHPEVSLEIEGHTDSRGSENYNLDLSERRAYAVRDWLIAQGVSESRLTAVGKGEGEPQTPEPDECHNAEPADTSSCEEVWATNRRVVFEVTGGEETIEEPPPPPPPPPPPKEEPVPPPTEPAPVAECPWLYGGHLNAFGPRSLVMAAAATQPGVCWLELSLGVGYGAGRYSAGAAGLTARGYYNSFSIPLRARAWFMEQGHSLVADLGLGVTHFRMNATAANAAEGRLDYDRHATPFLSTLAIGYGWRPEGPQPGYRFTAMFGGVFHPTTMHGSHTETEPPFAPGAADAVSTALDERTEDFTDPTWFFEASLGLLF